MMNKYKFNCLDEFGKKINGVLNSISKEEAIKVLKDYGYTKVKVRKIYKIDYGIFGKNISTQDILLVSQKFYMMLRSGFTISKVIDSVKESINNKELKEILIGVEASINKGVSLQEAIKEYSNKLPKYFICMFGLADKSENPVMVFKDLVSYYSSKIKFSKKVLSSLFYPIILVLFSFIAIFVLCTDIIPSFEQIFRESKVEVPIITKIIIDCAAFLRNNFLIIVLFIMILIMALIMIFRNKRMSYIKDKFKVKSSIFKKIHLYECLLEFSRYTKTLIDSGISLKDSLSYTINYLSNNYFKSLLKFSVNEINRGKDYTSSLKETDVFPSVFIDTLSISSNTSQVSYSLDSLISIYEEERMSYLSKISTLIEPISIVFISSIIVVILLSIYLPLFTMFDGLVV